MAAGTAKILCGQCIVPADMPDDPASGGELRCPACDRVDTVEKAVEDARRHATHMAKRAFEKKLLAQGRPLSRRTPTTAPERSLRWISNHAG